MFCPNCGKEVQATTKFCIYCGAAMPAESSSPSERPEQKVQPDISQNPITEAAGDAAAMPETPQPPVDNSANLSTVIKSNTAYYLSEFQKIDQGMKSAFNWPAFLLGPFFCLYRKCLDILAKYFGIPILLIVAATVSYVISVEKISFTALIVAQILSGIGSLFALICCIRSGKQFNREYYWHCNKVLKSGEKDSFGTSISYIFAPLIALLVIGSITHYLLKGDDDLYLPGYEPSQYRQDDIPEDDSLRDPTPEKPKIPETPESDVPEFQYADSEGIFDLGNGQMIEYFSSDYSVISQQLFAMTDYQATETVKELAGRYMGISGCLYTVYSQGEISLQLYDGNGDLLLDFVRLTLVPEQENLLRKLNQYDKVIALARMEDQYNFSDAVLLVVNGELLEIPYIAGNIPGLTTKENGNQFSTHANTAEQSSMGADTVQNTPEAVGNGYPGYYYNEKLAVALSPASAEDTFECTLYWSFGEFVEMGTVTPTVPSELSNGTNVMLQLNEGGDTLHFAIVDWQGEETASYNLTKCSSNNLGTLLSAYQNSYYNDSIMLELIQLPSGTDFDCTLYWIHGKTWEHGTVTPVIPSQLDGGTVLTLRLLPNEKIEVILDTEWDNYYVDDLISE